MWELIVPCTLSTPLHKRGVQIDNHLYITTRIRSLHCGTQYLVQRAVNTQQVPKRSETHAMPRCPPPNWRGNCGAQHLETHQENLGSAAKETDEQEGLKYAPLIACRELAEK